MTFALTITYDSLVPKVKSSTEAAGLLEEEELLILAP